MKEFRKSVAQLESRYQEEWLGWLSKLLDTTLLSDSSVPSGSCQPFSSNDE